MKTLSSITTRFVNLIRSREDGLLDIQEASQKLRVDRRRISDVVNVLLGLKLVKKMDDGRRIKYILGLTVYNGHFSFLLYKFP